MILILNILLPGTGLIIRRREWLGFCLVMLYGVCGNVAIAGRLIAPQVIPRQLGWLAVTMAACTWILAQALYLRQRRVLADRADGLAVLLREARSALESGDVSSASAALKDALAVDNEDPELNALFTRLGSIVRSQPERDSKSNRHPDRSAEASVRSDAKPARETPIGPPGPLD